MAQTTPLADWHRAHTAKMVDFAGWDMPDAIRKVELLPGTFGHAP